MGVMLPTLREERRKTYSPVLPISPDERPRAPGAGRGGRCRGRAHRASTTRTAPGRAIGARRAAKLQWKVDWAMRWVALGVDYEMAGKDLIDSVVQSAQDRARARRPPARGLQLRDVPRRKGREDLQVEGQRPQPRGMADATAARRASPSTSTASRKQAKSLHLGVIPRAVDEYWQFRGNYPEPADRAEARQSGPPHPRRQGAARERCRSPTGCCSISSACRASHDKDTAWRFVQRYAPGHLGRERSRARRADRPARSITRAISSCRR